MGKGTISKKGKAPSLHSRAARRATSPSINTDKSLKEVQLPPTSASEAINQRPAILAAHHGSGVVKKAKRGRRAVPSAKMRRRQERDMDRAAAVSDRTAAKIQRSKGQARVLHSRRRDWDDVNGEVYGGDAKARASAKKAAQAREQALVRAFFAEGGDMDVEEGTEEVDDDDDEGQQEGGEMEIPVEGITNISLRDAASVPPVPQPMADGDEIL